jgi:hypothetical protein
MDMFGGLTKTSSRIAIVAAFGLMLGGFAFKATPAIAADLGGDCCADLEERVAELEATTVRKGNKKVSVTLSGWVVKSINFWDDGDDSSVAIGDKDYDLASRFAITGSATIAPGWSGGFNLTITAPGESFGIFSNQNNEFLSANGTALFGDSNYSTINTLYSYIYIKSDTWGALNWGHLSPASDNPAVLADISGTVIESNFVWFEGGGFFLRPKGGGGGLSSLTWVNFTACNTLIALGTDCFGVAQPAVRYDSPTWGGFRFETSYGKNDFNTNTNATGFPSQDSNFADIAAFYTADWNSIKLSAAYAFTWNENTPLGTGESLYHQVGGSIMHKPSGLGIYAMGNWEDSDLLPDTNAWGVKPFWRKTWMPLGATVLYGEFAQYNDFFGSISGSDLCAGGTTVTVTNLTPPPPTAVVGGTAPGGLVGAPVCGAAVGGLFVTDSEAQRWGLGVVQEIDSAAMHVWLRWQHQDLDVSFVDGTGVGRNQGFEDFDFIQAGGVIFF